MSQNINNNEALSEEEYYPEIEINDFDKFDLEILEEINFARESPSEYALKLEDILKSIKDEKTTYLFLENASFIYTDLIGSLTESINFLKKQKKLPSLSFHPSLLDSCENLLYEYLYNPNYKNTNSTFENRLKSCGQPFGENYEIMCYDMFDPEFIVINLILSDGDKKKFERNVIFNPKIKYIGIISGFLNPTKICTIINCSEELLYIDEPVTQEIEKEFKTRKALYNSKDIPTKRAKYFSNQKLDINQKQKVKSNEKNIKQKNTNILRNNNNTKNISNNLRNPPNRIKSQNNIDSDLDYFGELDFYEKEFDTNYGKYEKDKNSYKKMFKTVSTTENGVQRTIITRIVENVDSNGIKKGYYIEEEEKNGDQYIKGRDSGKIEIGKKDMKINKYMEKRGNERISNEKYQKRIKEIPIKIKGKIGDINEREYFDEGSNEINYELPDGAIDLKEEKKTITDSNGEPAVEITKTITYEDGSVQRFVDRQSLEEE